MKYKNWFKNIKRYINFKKELKIISFSLLLKKVKIQSNFLRDMKMIDKY